jgi:hypothetical protein
MQDHDVALVSTGGRDLSELLAQLIQEHGLGGALRQIAGAEAFPLNLALIALGDVYEQGKGGVSFIYSPSEIDCEYPAKERHDVEVIGRLVIQHTGDTRFFLRVAVVEQTGDHVDLDPAVLAEHLTQVSIQLTRFRARFIDPFLDFLLALGNRQGSFKGFDGTTAYYGWPSLVFGEPPLKDNGLLLAVELGFPTFELLPAANDPC